MERLKYRTCQSQHANMYFWRTYDRQEIGLIEEYGGALHGYEFKWSSKKAPTVPRAWKESCPQASFTVIRSDNYQEFIVG